MSGSGVDALVEERRRLLTRVDVCAAELRAAKEDLKTAERVIMRTCRHDWRADAGQILGPGDYRDEVCTACGCRKVRPSR